MQDMTPMATNPPGLTGQDYFLQATALAAQGRGQEPAWLGELRRAGADAFARLGFPTRRMEGWRFTSLDPLLDQAFAPAPAADGERAIADKIQPYLLGDLPAHRLVFVNGRLLPALSDIAGLPAGIVLTSLREALRERPEEVRSRLGRLAPHAEHAFIALNLALHEDGVYLHVPRGRQIDAPIHLIFFSSGEPAFHAHIRNLLVLDAGARATLIESYAGAEGHACFNTSVAETWLEPDAWFDHYKLQEETRETIHVATHHVHQARASTFATHTISIGGGLIRNEINPVLDGEGIESTLNGLYILDGAQHLDNHTRFDHARPNCRSTQLYKGILDDRASAVFTGRILVREDAQKTDAFQQNRGLLLSPQASLNTQPQLEIFADDVRCTHGATIGQLDPEALFYLTTRGIDHQAARGLLTYAFANEIIEQIRIEPIHHRLEREIIRRFRGEEQGGVAA